VLSVFCMREEHPRRRKQLKENKALLGNAFILHPFAGLFNLLRRLPLWRLSREGLLP